MRSDDIAKELADLEGERRNALDEEARARCKAIFGEVPKDYCYYTEDMFGEVARVYVLRAHKREDLRRSFLPSHEWIALWHKYEPDVSVEDLLEDARSYVDGGCGFSG